MAAHEHPSDHTAAEAHTHPHPHPHGVAEPHAYPHPHAPEAHPHPHPHVPEAHSHQHPHASEAHSHQHPDSSEAHTHQHPHASEARAHPHPHPHAAGYGHGHGEEHGHEHEHPGGLKGLVTGLLRPHSHDAADSLDEALAGSNEGIRAVKISLVGLGITAILQLAVALLSGSVGLLADTIHNFADASTAIPLWLAFSISRRPANRRYTYGYGRAEDLAGVFVILMIAGSAAVAAWQSIERLIHPRPLTDLGWVAAAAVLGFIGNELVARHRIRAGERIGSAALIADGYHARTDGLTSLAVLIGVAGAWFGFQQLDALVGIGITVAILSILKDAARQIWRRLMDSIDPALLERVAASAAAAEGVREVSAIRGRWIGHSIHVEALIVADGELSLSQAHAVAERARHAVLHDVPKVRTMTVHVDPLAADGQDAHAELAHHDSDMILSRLAS